MLYVNIWVVIYLVIGLAIYFTLPNRDKMPINISIPLIVAWLPFAIASLFSGKQEDKKE